MKQEKKIVAVLKLELRALHLLEVLLPLEPTPNTFCFRYFQRKVSHLCLDHTLLFRIQA
jgi:hypothetical protein